MQAILKVVGGKNNGREIKINVPEFIIGRGENAQLRPSSDMISRMHCAIRLKDGKVEIEDLGSRNGSFVNDQQLTSAHQAKSGDRLRVGRLTFEVLIDPVKAGNKKPKVKDVAEAAARTVEKPKPKQAESFDNSINDWLTEPDDTPLSGMFDNNETVQFSMDDVQAIIEAENELKQNGSVDEQDSEEEQESGEIETEDGKKKKKKKEFGKLPDRPKFSHDDSTSAAGDVLKKFFNRR